MLQCQGASCPTLRPARTTEHALWQAAASCSLKPGLTNMLLLDHEDDRRLVQNALCPWAAKSLSCPQPSSHRHLSSPPRSSVLVSSWPLLRSSYDQEELLRRMFKGCQTHVPMKHMSKHTFKCIYISIHGCVVHECVHEYVFPVWASACCPCTCAASRRSRPARPPPRSSMLHPPACLHRTLSLRTLCSSYMACWLKLFLPKTQSLHILGSSYIACWLKLFPPKTQSLHIWGSSYID